MKKYTKKEARHISRDTENCGNCEYYGEVVTYDGEEIFGCKKLIKEENQVEEFDKCRFYKWEA